MAIVAFTASQVSAYTFPTINQQKLEAAQNRWQKKGIQQYQFEYLPPGVARSSSYVWDITVNSPDNRYGVGCRRQPGTRHGSNH